MHGKIGGHAFGVIAGISIQRKEKEGNEEDGELGFGSSGIIGLFLWLWGFQGSQVEMPEVWSRFHR